jgi:hypothetical protein
MARTTTRSTTDSGAMRVSGMGSLLFESRSHEDS